MLKLRVKIKLTFKSLNSNASYVASMRAEALSTCGLDAHCANSDKLIRDEFLPTAKTLVRHGKCQLPLGVELPTGVELDHVISEGGDVIRT